MKQQKKINNFGVDLLTKLHINPTICYTILSILFLFIIFWKFLFQGNYLLYLDIGNDSYYQVYAFLKAINHLFSEKTYVGWSFSFGIGQLVSGIYTGNIFNWGLFFINPKYIPFGMTIAEMIKLFLTGLIYYKYLKNKNYSLSISVFGGCLILLSSYMIVNAGWFQYFSYSGFLLVFWLFSLEKLKNGNVRWLIFVISLVAIDQPFNLYLFGVFSVFYFFLQKNTFENWKKISLRLFISYFSGILLGAILFGSNLNSMVNSPRLDSKYSYFTQLFSTSIFKFASFDELKTSFLRFFSTNIQGIGYDYNGWGIYVESPLFFISGFSILLVSQWFDKNSERFSKKNIFCVILIIVVLVFPFFRYAIWLFSGDYYRILSFAIALLLFEASLKILDQHFNNKVLINSKLLIINFLVLISLFFFFKNYTTTFFYKSIVFLIINFLMIYFSILKQQKKTLFFILLFAIFDGLIESFSTINNRPVVTSNDFAIKKGFNDYSQDAVDWIRENDKGFYRIEKDFSSGHAKIASLNDGMAQGYNSTKIFTSFNHLNYVKYLKGMEELKFDTEYETRWIFGGIDRFEMLDNLAVKYVISDGKFDWKKVGYQQVKLINNVIIYKNPKYLPLGSVFTNVIGESDFETLPIEKKRGLISDYLVVSDKKIEEIIENSSKMPDGSSIKLSDTNLKIKAFENNYFAGNLTNSKFSILYFSILFDEGWKIEIDGTESEKFIANYGMTAIMLPPGNHSVRLEYELPFFKPLLVFNFLGLIAFIFVGKLRFLRL